MVEGRGVCCIALLPAVLATLGIGSSILSTVWCEAIKFVPDLTHATELLLPDQVRETWGLSSTDNNNDDTSIFGNWKFGLYYHSQIQDIDINSAGDTIVRVTDTCVYYGDDVDMDAAWKTARAFAIIAPLTAAIFGLGLYMSPCCIFFNKATWNSIACIFLLVIPALQSLTLLFLTSDACDNNPVIQQRINQIIASLRGDDWMAAAAASASSSTTSAEALTDNNSNMTDISNNATDAAVETTTTIDESTTTTTMSDEDALRSIYSSDCEWDWGMYANLASMILFFVCGVIMLLMGPPTRPPPKEPIVQTIEYEQKINQNDNGEDVENVEEVNVTTETYDPKNWANPAHEAKPY